MNTTALVGRLVKEPMLRQTGNNLSVASFTLAINRRFHNKNETDYIPCVIWRKPAETLAKYARKGTLVSITGRLQTRSYTNDKGNNVFVMEVVVEQFQLLESKAVAERREQEKALETPLPPAPQANVQEELPAPSEQLHWTPNDLYTNTSVLSDIPPEDLPFG